MSKIFCLMGKSSSGKDTIFKELCNNNTINLQPIISYTTRPKRINETDGVEYNFISIDELKQYEELGKIIEVRKYDTVYGPWYYGTIDDGQINLAGTDNYIVIVTLEAYKSYIEYFGREYVYPIYIDIDDGLRLERALTRERGQKQPNYEEMCRRFLADSNDFSADNLKECEINNSYINVELNQCIDEILNDIRKEVIK